MVWRNQCIGMKDANFLRWIHSRLEHQHGENPDVDYMIRLRQIADEVERQFWLDDAATDHPPGLE